jgi:hypothetical protein
MSAWDRFLSEWLSLPLIGNINQWGLDHPVEVGTIAVFITVLLSLLLLGTLARSFSGSAANQTITPLTKPTAESVPAAPLMGGESFDAFEKHLALSGELLSEVGLSPLQRPDAAQSAASLAAGGEIMVPGAATAETPAQRYYDFLDGLTVEELLVVVRYSLLRESGEDAREAVKRVSQRGTPEQRRQALALMEEA